MKSFRKSVCEVRACWLQGALPICARSQRLVAARALLPRCGTGQSAETHEAWLEDNRYINMDLLKEQKKAAMKIAA